MIYSVKGIFSHADGPRQETAVNAATFQPKSWDSHFVTQSCCVTHSETLVYLKVDNVKLIHPNRVYEKKSNLSVLNVKGT